MASISTSKTGTRRIVFAGANGAHGFGLEPSAEAVEKVLDGVFIDAGISIELQVGPQSRLAAIHAVKQAVVVRQAAARGDRLIAHLAAAGDARPTVEEIRQALREHLPDYMPPSAVVWHESLPLTRNGKVDRGKLAALPPPAPATESARAGAPAPAGAPGPASVRSSIRIMLSDAAAISAAAAPNT